VKTKNLTPFPFGTKVTSRRPPRPEMTLIVRACYLITPGRPLTLPEGPGLLAQGPLTAETYRDDDEERAGECLYPGDFADWKPRADVMLRGTCHTPRGEPLVESAGAHELGLVFERLAHRRIRGREGQVVHHGPEVQAGAPDEQHLAPTAVDRRHRLMCELLVARHCEGLRRLRDVEEVVRDTSAKLGRRLGGPDVHPPVHGRRVHAHDLGAEALGDPDRRLALARGGRPDDREERRLGAGCGHQATAAGSRTGSPSRWCGCAATIATSTKSPGA